MNECKCPKDYTEILVTYVYFGVYMVSKGKVLVCFYSQIFFTIYFFKFNFLIIWWHGVFVHSLCQTLGKVDMQFLCYAVMDIFKHHNFLTTTTLWQTDSADEKLMIFFSENRLWCFMQIVSLKEAIFMKYQSLTSGKNKKDYFKMFSAYPTRKAFNSGNHFQDVHGQVTFTVMDIPCYVMCKMTHLFQLGHREKDRISNASKL